MMMRPMSLFESGRSSGSVSLRRMFNGTEEYGGMSSINPSEIAGLICRGGWPAGLRLDDDIASMVPRNYISMISSSDTNRAYGNTWSSATMGRIVRSLARNNAT
jgi:hypothetical protein